MMKKMTKMMLLGLGIGVLIGAIAEDPEGFCKLMKALKDDKTKKVEIDIKVMNDEIR